MLNKRYGKLLVTEFKGKDTKGNKEWLCLCDCGNLTTKTTVALNRGAKSCGCISSDRISNMNNIRDLKKIKELSESLLERLQ